MMRSSKYTLGFIAGCAAFCLSNQAHALPFNDDMVTGIKPGGGHAYYATGQIMREKAPGSIAMGELRYEVKSKEEAAATLQNPIKGDEKSIPVGKRLFQVNCSPCHGNIEAAPYVTGPVTQDPDPSNPNPARKFATPVDITQEPYRTIRNDGYLYGVMNFGGLAVMPPVGWKLSPQEHWEIINYVRYVQSVKAQAGK